MVLLVLALVFLVSFNFCWKIFKGKGFVVITLIAIIYSIIPIYLMVSVEVPEADQYRIAGFALHSPLIGTAMLLVVAFSSRLKAKLNNLMRLRTELSIIGFIFIIGHISYHLAAQLFYEDKLKIVAMSTPLMLLMIPLWITSFKFFKIKLKQNWKKLHMLAYPAYALILLHAIFDKLDLGLSNDPNIEIKVLLNNICYILIMIVYLALLTKDKLFQKSNKTEIKKGEN